VPRLACREKSSTLIHLMEEWLGTLCGIEPCCPSWPRAQTVPADLAVQCPWSFKNAAEKGQSTVGRFSSRTLSDKLPAFRPFWSRSKIPFFNYFIIVVNVVNVVVVIVPVFDDVSDCERVEQQILLHDPHDASDRSFLPTLAHRDDTAGKARVLVTERRQAR
jgi:hypothetical protein